MLTMSRQCKPRLTNWKGLGPSCCTPCLELDPRAINKERSMKAGSRFALSILLLLAASAAAQQRQRDPLTDLEIDKLRDAAQLPEVRLELYVDFARARLDNMEKVRADTKAENREKQTRD